MAGILKRAFTRKEGPKEETPVVIPFDLNKIFSLTYEFQPLKEVLEYLFGELHKGKDLIN